MSQLSFEVTMMPDDILERAAAGELGPEMIAPAIAELAARGEPPVWVESSLYPIKGVLRDHQRRALTEADEKHGHCYWMDPGAGKTLTCIAESGKLWIDGKSDGTLIFAPNGPHEQWVDEQFPLWADFPWRGVTNRYPKGQIRKFFETEFRKQMPVAAINFESLATKNGQHFIETFLELYPRAYIIDDESQKTANPKAARTKEVLYWSLQEGAYKRALSGTPLLKALTDLWSQYEFAEAGLAWPDNPLRYYIRGRGVAIEGYHNFRSYHCVFLKDVTKDPKVKESNAGNMVVEYRHEAEFQDRVRDHTTRVMADEFMKGEKPDFIKVRCPMGAEQRQHYNLMKEELLVVLEDDTITAQNALVQMGKLLQIASGFIYDENKNPIWVSDNKINAAETLLESLDEPTLIWVPFIPLRQPLKKLLKKMGRDFIEYRERADVDRWKDMGKDAVMFGNQGSGMGVGLNLQHSAANIYLANTFSSEHRWQSLKRTDRMGQERQVRNWDLIAPATADNNTFTALQKKEDLSRRTIDGLRKMIT